MNDVIVYQFNNIYVKYMMFSYYFDNISIMSTGDFTKKTDKIRKDLNVLRKDINHRDDISKRGQAVY